jgi:D-alanyl-D-alanine carboxypeptidase (penicillin-binding protein 5/6)
MFKFTWIALLSPLWLFAEPLQYEIKGEAAIVINADTGAILFEKGAYQQRYPASTTKIATALYALTLKGDDLEMLVTAEQDSVASITQEAKQKSNYKHPSYWLEPDGMHIGVKRGEILSLHDLLKGMLINSGNDAANLIAQGLAPSIPLFMDQLNLFLKQLGCQHTHFTNPHGLHDPKHVSTPYELALITREALKNHTFREIVCQKRFLRPKTNKQEATTLLQTNRLLRPGKYYYSKAIGVKTGYHAKAKRAFVGAAQSDNRTLILVLMGYASSNDIFQDAINLFEAAFNQPKVQRLYLKAGPQKFALEIPQASALVKTYLAEGLALDYYLAEDPQAKCYLCWDPLVLPIKKDQKVGTVQLVTADGKVLKTAPLLASKEVKLSWPYNWFKKLPFWGWTVFLGGILFVLWILLRLNKR